MQLFETISGAFAAFLPASSSLPFSSFSSPSSSSSFPHTTDVNANVPASEEPQERRVFSRQEQLMKDHENRLIKFGLDWFHRYRRDPSSFSSEREENNGQEGCLVKSSAHDIRIQGFCDDDGGSAYIHYVKYSPSTLKDETEDGFTKTKMAPFLLLPGYGCGLGVFYASAPILADRLQTDVLAVDQFGCGLSTRPLWKGGFHLDDGQRSEDRSSSSSSSSPIDTMESLFVESLEAFRKALGEEKISLVGHSMGGYLASCYSLAYPERVEHLVLASPVGVPLSPSLVNHPSSTTSLPDSSSEENTQSSEQQKAAEGAEDGNKGSWMPLTVPTAADIKNSLRSVLANSVKNAWRQGYGPFNFPVVTDLLLNQYFLRRFPALNEDKESGGHERIHGTKINGWFNRELLAPYFSSNFSNGNPSLGGYSHAVLLYPGAFARRPLCQRLTALVPPAASTASRTALASSSPPFFAENEQASQTVTRKKGGKDDRFPRSITFLYGTHDWMDFRHAVAFREKVERDTDREARERGGNGRGRKVSGEKSETENEIERRNRKIYIGLVEGAGHNFTMENPLGFVDAIESSIVHDGKLHQMKGDSVAGKREEREKNDGVGTEIQGAAPFDRSSTRSSFPPRYGHEYVLSR